MRRPAARPCLGFLLALAGGSGCTVVNHIDTCDPIADVDHQVNATTAGDQSPTPGAALARIGPDLYVAAWVSESDTATELRAALMHADGTVKPPCGSNAGDVAISTDDSQVVSGPSVAVGPTGNGPIFFAWRSTPSASNGQGAILVRLMDQDLCSWNSDAVTDVILTASDDTDDGVNPVVAARSDGLEAIVAWVSVPFGSNVNGLFRIRSRPVSVAEDNVGRVEPNACDGTDAPCTHAMLSLAAGPTITAFGSGYALAWPERREDANPGFEVRVQVLDQTGAIESDHTGQRPFGDVLAVDLASAATATEIRIAEASEPREQSTPAAGDTDCYLERFGADGTSLAPPEKVNSDTGGQHEGPAIAVIDQDASFVAWTAVNGATEVWGRVLAADGTPLFGGVSCDANNFRLSSVDSTRETAPSLASDTGSVLSIFGDKTTAPGGTDTLGLSVHARRFDIPHLFPALR